MDDNIAKNTNNEMLMQGTEKLASGDTELSLDEIQGAYNNVGKDYSQLVQNAVQDVGNRQQQLIGNNFGAVNPYMENTYYNGASSTTQSAIRAAGTQAAFETGMERGKQAAKDALSNAKNNYSNAQNAYSNAKSAYENAQQELQNQRNLKIAEIQAQDFGEGTSTAEAMAMAGTAGHDKEYYYQQYRPKATSDKYVTDWNVQSIRDAATDATLQQFGMTRSDLDSMSQEQKDAFWSRSDIGNYWTNQYASRWIGDNLGDDALQQYTNTYNKITESISQMYDYVTGVTDNIDSLFTTFNISAAADASVGDIPVPIFGIDTSDEARAELSVYTKMNADNTGADWYIRLGDGQEVSLNELREKNQSNQNITAYIDWVESHPGEANAITSEVKPEVQAGKEAILKAFATGSSVKYDRTENLNSIFQNTFGFDYNDAKNVINFSKEHPDEYNKFIQEVTMAASGLDLLEVADGKKSYHTAAGDEVFDEGTIVMYTLPGYTDSEGNILDPDLREYVNLRKQILNPTAETDVEKLQEAMNEAYTKYMKGVQGQLFALNNYGLTVNNDTTAAMLFLKNPTEDNAKKLKIGDKTIEEFIKEFQGMGTHEQYRAYASLVKRMASQASSYIVKDGNELTYMSKQDATGKETIGSEGEEDLYQDMSAEEALSKILVLDQAIRTLSGDLVVKADFFDAEQNGANENILEFAADLTRRFLYNLATDVDIITGIGTAAVGALTGNINAKNPLSLTGRDNLVDLFTGDIEEGDLFYTEDRRTLQQDNMVKVVNPLLSDAWFGDEGGVTATGSGHASNEGMNALLNTLAELGGLIGPGVVESVVAGLAKSGVKAAAKKLGQEVLVHSFGYADNVVSGLSDDALRAAAKEQGLSDDVIRYLSRESLEDTAKSSFDDITKGASKEEKILAAGKNSDEAARLTETGASIASNGYDDIVRRSGNEVAGLVVDEQQKVLASLSNTISYADNLASSSFIDDFSDYFIKQIKMGVNSLDNASEAALRAVGRGLGKQVAEKTINTALVSSVLGRTVDEVVSLSDDTINLLAAGARDAVYKQGTASTRATRFLGNMSAEAYTKTANELIGHIEQAAKAGRAWTNNDTLRFLARKGWSSENTLLNAQKFLRDASEDMARDIVYGYTHPTLTNEGTDRETIDEYFKNPLNYLFNIGAATIQKVGGRLFNHIGETVTAKQLEKAQNALSAVDRQDTEALAKAVLKVNKLNDKAQRYADKALERGLDYDTVMSQARKADDFAKQSMLEAVEKSMMTFDPEKIPNAGKSAKTLQAYIDAKRGSNAQMLYAAMNASTIRSQNAYYMGLRSMGAYDRGLASITDKATNLRMMEVGMLERAKHTIDIDKWRDMTTGQKLAHQKKVYEYMRKAIVDDMHGAIPGLDDHLQYYFNELLDLQKYGLDKGFITGMRQGFIPINSYVVSPYDVPIAARGYSFGVDVEASPNFTSPNASMRRETFDYDIVKALQNGETTIDHIGKDGIEAMDIYAEGSNFLDNLTVYRNTLYRDVMMSPILGNNRTTDFGAAQAKAGGTVVQMERGKNSERVAKATAKLDEANTAKDIDAILANKKAIETDKVRAAKKALEAEQGVAKDINKANATDQVQIRKNQKEIKALTSSDSGANQNVAYSFLTSKGFTRENCEEIRNCVLQDIKWYREGNAAGTVRIRRGTAEVSYGTNVKNRYKTKDGKYHTRSVYLDKDYLTTLDRVSKAGADASATDINDLIVLKANQIKSKEDFVKANPYDESKMMKDVVLYNNGKYDVTAKQVAKVPVNTEYGMEHVRNILANNMGLRTTKEGKLMASDERLLDSIVNSIRARAEESDGKFFVSDAIEYADNMLPDKDLHSLASDLGLYRKLNSLDNNGFTLNDFAEYIDGEIAKIELKRRTNQQFSQSRLDTLLDARMMLDTMSEYSATAKGKGSFDIAKYEDLDLENSAEYSGSTDIYGNANASEAETMDKLERNIADEDGVITGETLPEKIVAEEATLDKNSMKDGINALDSIATELTTAEDNVFKQMQKAKIAANNAIKDVANDFNALVINASKKNDELAKMIAEETKQRKRRQGDKSGAKYDALHAVGVASPESGITLEKSPTQYRAALAEVESGNAGYSQKYNKMLLDAGTQGGHLEQMKTSLGEMYSKNMITAAEYDAMSSKIDNAAKLLPTFQMTEGQFSEALTKFTGGENPSVQNLYNVLGGSRLTADELETAKDIVTRLDKTKANLQKAREIAPLCAIIQAADGLSSSLLEE